MKPNPAGACSGKTAISFNESLSYPNVQDEAGKWVNVSTRVGFYY